MKLGIGTAQFGMKYGAFRGSGRTTRGEVAAILEAGMDKGFCVLDTAPAYGESEEIIGQSLGGDHRYQIVTKTPFFSEERLTVRHADELQYSFGRSCERLRQPRLYGLLVHHAEDLMKEGSERLYQAMQELKRQGAIEKIGVSVYREDQITAITSRFPLDLIQLPVNVFDQRLIRSGTLQHLQAKGIEIHARSVFLQGLLLTPPDKLPVYFSPVQARIASYHQTLEKQGLTPAEAALGFLSRQAEIDAVILGIDSLAQLERNAEDVQRGKGLDDFAPYAIDDPAFVDPRLWPSTWDEGEGFR